MRTFMISVSCLAVALLLTSFVPLGGGSSLQKAAGAISTFDLTIAAGTIGTPDYVDAH